MPNCEKCWNIKAWILVSYSIPLKLWYEFMLRSIAHFSLCETNYNWLNHLLPCCQVKVNYCSLADFSSCYRGLTFLIFFNFTIFLLQWMINLHAHKTFKRNNISRVHHVSTHLWIKFIVVSQMLMLKMYIVKYTLYNHVFSEQERGHSQILSVLYLSMTLHCRLVPFTSVRGKTFYLIFLAIFFYIIPCDLSS